MVDGHSMTTITPSRRKVRVACQRCRYRRIKCDGGVPGCTSCINAGVACIDVDARNADQLVPRKCVVPHEVTFTRLI